VQSWSDDASKPVRSPSFDISEKDGFWTGGAFTKQRGRPAHLYLFAWHAVSDRALADHRALSQWTFFLIEARALPANQKKIRLNVLKRLGATQAPSIELGKTLEIMRQRLF
jgi:hypothetical protein